MAYGDDDEVGSLTLKLPTFWTDKPEAWFILAEANFRARRITNKIAMFNHLVANLDSTTINGLLDILNTPPDDTSYDRVKARLVQSFKMATVDRVKQALDLPALADENPVTLADNVMALTRDATAEDMAKTIYLLKLPEGVKRTMWAEPLTSWATMKDRAKGLWQAEKTKSRATIYKTSEAARPDTNAVKDRPRTQQGGKKKSKFQEYADSYKQPPNGPCVYHDFYGKSANKCQAPCSQAGNASAGRR